ncbi:MAG TPA: DUF4255 domain-containing protein [Rhizomicrobium sp.]|nr:DUF4255 domain-containing protein [Rhizomicrobium sp.]
MSNSLAIATVTATLQALLLAGLKSAFATVGVTIQPLDKARPTGTTGPQVNLFLYQVQRNAAWANADMPRQNLPGELSIPPLPLNLYYLLTVYGDQDDIAEPGGHELLGRAMSVLYDHPVLSADDIRTATTSILTDNDLADQLEHVRITLHPISVDELSKLWTGFATQYRLSVAYEVGVALIESTRAAAAPLPVLTRGPGDSGVDAQGNLLPVVPTLVSVTAPNSQPAAVVGDVVSIAGYNLDGANLHVELTHPRLATPLVRPVMPGHTDTSAQFLIPGGPPGAFPPGFYGVTFSVKRPGENFVRTTNQLTLPIAPKMKVTPQTAAAGTISYSVSCAPEVWAGQKVLLLLGDQEITYVWPKPAPATTATLGFPNVTLARGVYQARLRVDGVDSLLVDRTKKPPVFDPSQKVTVT